ncbi:MAG: trehalose-6-phosphate synthase [Thermodesulfobacteriota bacterium]
MLNKKLVIVSNREPYSHRKGRVEKAAGGVVTALDPIMQKNHGIWVAWGSGEEDRKFADEAGRVKVPPENPSYTLKRVWLTEKQIDDYYHGYSNRFLWPLCHMVLDRVYLKRSYWTGYKKVNQLFADAIVDEVRRKKAIVWLHDYHLAICASYIKERNPELPTTIFWHIPWPPYDVFRICPQRKDLLEGMLANDIVGFQLESFCENFMNCASAELGAKIDIKKRVIYYKGHATGVRAFPISVDFRWFESSASSKKEEGIIKRLMKSHRIQPGVIIGLGVDRLDYTKGLTKRLETIDLFFSKYPRFKEKFTFVQVAVPTRKVEPYLSYRKGVENKIRNINHKYGSDMWNPIVYIDTRMDQEKLSALYRAADIAIISSIYDGMNLVAKEYIASQVDEKGVLLLSEFAGAAEEIPGVTLINPYDIEGCADAIKNALERPLVYKIEAIREARAYVKKNDIFKWVDEILEEIKNIG